jgi:signal transduction histidine kinase
LTTEAIDALSAEKRRVRLLAGGAGILCLLLAATIWLVWRLRKETLSLRSAEGALRRSGEHSRMLVDLLPDTLYTVDEENTITVRNEGGRRTEMVEAIEASELHRRKVREALSSGETVLEEEKLHEDLYVEYRLVPLGSDQPGKAMGILRDVTERRKAEALHAALEEAQKLEIVGRVAGGVANDFNNLLTVINGYSDALLKNSELDQTVRMQLESIQRAGATAAELTQNLLAFSRKPILDLRPVDVNAIVKNLDILIRRVMGDNVRLDTELASDLLPVLGDPGQISQILMNLIVNARDAMPHGGELRIQTANPEASGDYVMISVTDNGTGISERTKADLFEPFFTTKELGKGKALGLATVYGIVRQLGGNIVVESEENQGSTFRVYLRIAQVHASAAG